MSSGSAIRGSRAGAGPSGEAVRGEVCPRVQVSYYCANGHITQPSFAVDAQIPEQWECMKCGLPANLDQRNPPPPPKTQPYKTHLAYVKERRSSKEAHAILEEALSHLKDRRARGEVIY
ncbi:RNA polymerase-binding protein [Propionibacterium cyclohexanicum]|uniref:RNA polymerase-binding protein RbpA n=1 Tax=Propionibacterium cyclohexanicum TaxID=64702 RepID=A0A1H9PMW8_9ACTN|nr:RNA polymerase-binding protein RbpA [Propionibacterium cyclohexanicum]SER48913.1 RNA polymerase-binding protein [Propionibacterium cyclohexanicum]